MAIGHNNQVGPLVLQFDRCGKTSDRADCGLNQDHCTLHCPACGEPLDMVRQNDLVSRYGPNRRV